MTAPPVPWVLADGLGLTPKHPPGGRGVPEQGECAWCRTQTETLWAHTKVVSANFVGWNQIRATGEARWFCRRCAAVLSSRRPVNWPTGVEARTDGTATELISPSQILAALSSPVNDDRCLLIATNRQKHTSLNARWGCIATAAENFHMRWTADDVDLLEAYNELRWQHSASEVALAEPDLRRSVLIGSPNKPACLALWDRLARWRDTPTYLQIGALATRNDKPRKEVAE